MRHIMMETAQITCGLSKCPCRHVVVEGKRRYDMEIGRDKN